MSRVPKWLKRVALLLLLALVTLAKVRTGTGLLILAADHVEVYGNTFRGNKTAGVGVFNLKIGFEEDLRTYSAQAMTSSGMARGRTIALISRARTHFRRSCQPAAGRRRCTMCIGDCGTSTLSFASPEAGTPWSQAWTV